MVDPEVLDKIKRACCPQKAIYDIANYVETDVIPPINEATNTANAAAAQANSAYNRATDALNTANAVAEDVSRSLVDLNASGDGSTVTLNAPRNTGNPATAPLPVADATKAGVMNSATYVNLQNLNTRVSSLENQTTTYVVSFTNDNPTQDEINNAYKTAYPTAPFPPIDGTTVIDSTRQLYYRWVKNGAIWLKTTGFVISQWTNETLGTVKGSTIAGQIQAETDGTGSLVGYDQIKNDIAANATGIQTLTANLGTTNSNVTALTTRVNTNTSNIANAVNTINTVGTGTGASINYVKMGGTQASTALPVVSTSQAGIVTPIMFNQWNAGKEEKYQTVIVKNTGNWYDGEYEGDAYPHPYANITLKDGTIIKFETSGTGTPGGGGGGPSPRWRLIFNPEPTYNTFIIGTFRSLTNGEFSSPTSFSSISEWVPVPSKIITPRFSVSQYGNHIHITIINLDTGLIVDELILSVLRSTEKISNYEYKRDVLFMSKNGITVTDFTV